MTATSPPPAPPELLTPGRAAELLTAVRAEIGRVIVGQQRVVERVLVGLLAGGHCLLEGAPGLGKTRLLTTLATSMGGDFNRIQFTPDLLPSDIVGTRIWRQEEGRFSVELGPVFANFVLADEINRAPAKVQSALLEVMAEKQVTIGGETYPVQRPFLVLATQNPIESEGVYQLPEAQRDRFLMKVPVDYPAGPHEEMEIVRRAAGDSVDPTQVISLDDVRDLQATTRAIHVDPRVADYAVRLVLASREPARQGLDSLTPLIAFGASPRASIGLVEGARALALLRGRGAVEPQDIYDIGYDVLNHRLVLSFDAVADGVSVDEVLYHLLTTIPAPQVGSGPTHHPSQRNGDGAHQGPQGGPGGFQMPGSAQPRMVASGPYGQPGTAPWGGPGSPLPPASAMPPGPQMPPGSPMPPAAATPPMAVAGHDQGRGRDIAAPPTFDPPLPDLPLGSDGPPSEDPFSSAGNVRDGEQAPFDPSLGGDGPGADNPFADLGRDSEHDRATDRGRVGSPGPGGAAGAPSEGWDLPDADVPDAVVPVADVPDGVGSDGVGSDGVGSDGVVSDGVVRVAEDPQAEDPSSS